MDTVDVAAPAYSVPEGFIVVIRCFYYDFIPDATLRIWSSGE
jgi:hypothetical protein